MKANPVKILPHHTPKWLIALSTGFALFFVLYIYKGYDIQQGTSFSGHGLFFRSTAFGSLTFLSFFIHEFVLLRWIALKGRLAQVCWVIWEIFVGANLTFLLFNYFWDWTEGYWRGYFLMLFEYTCVVIFPILAVKAVFGRKQTSLPIMTGPLVFVDENGKKQLSIDVDHLLYLKSADNYVEVYYLSGQQVKSDLIRNSLKHIENTMGEHSKLSRCHRSYMVNPTKIEYINFAQRPMTLVLGHDIFVPVSQKYKPRFET